MFFFAGFWFPCGKGFGGILALAIMLVLPRVSQIVSHATRWVVYIFSDSVPCHEIVVVVHTIAVSYTACKYEFLQNPGSHGIYVVAVNTSAFGI